MVPPAWGLSSSPETSAVLAYVCTLRGLSCARRGESGDGLSEASRIGWEELQLIYS